MPWIWGKNRYLSEWHTGVGKTDPASHDVQVLSQGAFQQLMEQGQASNKGFAGAEIFIFFFSKRQKISLFDIQYFIRNFLSEPVVMILNTYIFIFRIWPGQVDWRGERSTESGREFFSSTIHGDTPMRTAKKVAQGLPRRPEVIFHWEGTNS